MRVIPVPKSIRSADWVLGTKVYSSPTGDLADPVVPPAEGIIFKTHPIGAPDGTEWPATAVVLELDADDLEQINRGARHLIMGWPGVGMPVFLVPYLYHVDNQEA